MSTHTIAKFSIKPIFGDKTRLFIYGLLIAGFGIIFWIISLIPHLFVGWLDLFQVGNISNINGSGLLAAQMSFGIASVVIFGWGLTIVAVSLDYSNTARLFLVTGLLGWFLMDCLSSIIFGFYYNVIFNLIFLVTGLIILYTTPLGRNSDEKEEF